MEGQMELPPGFRFHPTDEELITHYLTKKVINNGFSSVAIGEVDMNKIEPWDLPWKAKLGEKEWYFFCVRDKKYPTGLRTNRATATGYWKATGKDKEIFRGKTLVGMKKTLVFYRGRAPKGQKSNWVSHEYRLEGKLPLDCLPKSSRNDWVISRVFQKTHGGKKVHISGLVRINSVAGAVGNESALPPLMDYPKAEPGHVHCFSNTVDPSAPQKYLDVNFLPCFNNNPMDFPGFQFPAMAHPGIGLQFPEADPGILRTFFENQNQHRKETITVSPETDQNSFERNEGNPIGPQDFDCIWSY